MSIYELSNATACFYRRYIPRYPARMIDVVTNRIGAQSGILLDIGYGGGEATFALAPYFDKVLAWNLDNDILALADDEIKKRKIKNIVLEQKSERDIGGLSNNSLSLVVVAQSMYSIDASKLFEDLFHKVKAGGGIAIIEGNFVALDGIFAQAVTVERDRIISQVINRYIRTSRRKIEKYTENVNSKDYTELLADAGYKKVRARVFEEDIERDINNIIGWIYANPLFARQKFGKKADKFERELTRKLKRFAKSGIFRDRVCFTLITAEK